MPSLPGEDAALRRGSESGQEVVGEGIDVDQRPCMEPGRNGEWDPWVDGLLYHSLWASAWDPRTGLKPSKRPFELGRLCSMGLTARSSQSFPSLDGHPFIFSWVPNPTSRPQRPP